MRERGARIIQTIPPPNLYSSNQERLQQHIPLYHKYIPTSEAFLTRKISEAVDDLGIQQGKDTLHINSGLNHKQKIPLNLQTQRQYQFNSPREVSETDLYLLGAIEKLVFRVDYMEKRLRRSEQIIYYLMAGNNQKIESDACPKNFTKINNDCYYFGVKERVDWKNAAANCRSLKSNLVEFEKIENFQDVIAHTLSTLSLRGSDFWIGGLNPGLLWIWSTSARPINPNANLTSLSNKTTDSKKVPAKVLSDAQNANKNNTLFIKVPEINGNGRCLRLTFNSTLFNYGYTGQDCASKQHYMCMIVDKSLDNVINRVAKTLMLDLN